MRLKKINVVGLQPAKRFVHAAQYALRGKVEVLKTIATCLGGQQHFVASADQRLAQSCFGKGQSIVRRGIKKIDAVLNSEVYRADDFRRIGEAVKITQRPGAKPENRRLKPRLSELPVFHVSVFRRRAASTLLDTVPDFPGQNRRRKKGLSLAELTSVTAAGKLRWHAPPDEPRRPSPDQCLCAPRDHVACRCPASVPDPSRNSSDP